MPLVCHFDDLADAGRGCEPWKAGEQHELRPDVRARAGDAGRGRQATDRERPERRKGVHQVFGRAEEAANLS